MIAKLYTGIGDDYVQVHPEQSLPVIGSGITFLEGLFTSKSSVQTDNFQELSDELNNLDNITTGQKGSYQVAYNTELKEGYITQDEYNTLIDALNTKTIVSDVSQASTATGISAAAGSIPVFTNPLDNIGSFLNQSKGYFIIGGIAIVGIAGFVLYEKFKVR